MTSLVMNKALDFKMPQSMPQVSRLRPVLAEAAFKKSLRSCDGRKMLRKGSPFSKYAEGLKVNSSKSLAGVGGRAVSGSFAGIGGAEGVLSEYLAGTGGGRW